MNEWRREASTTVAAALGSCCCCFAAAVSTNVLLVDVKTKYLLQLKVLIAMTQIEIERRTARLKEKTRRR